MMSMRTWLSTLCAVVALATLPAVAWGDVPVGPARLVDCPTGTDDHYRYSGPLVPYRCHSAVVDPLEDVVLLRQGRSEASGPGAFGMLHALLDHNVADNVMERVVSSAYPLSAPGGRRRYIAEFRRDGYGVMAVWVEVDRAPSKAAPDGEPFGIVTAYCKIPARAGPENLCPAWVNDTL